jgi:hypothetical protein
MYKVIINDNPDFKVDSEDINGVKFISNKSNSLSDPVTYKDFINYCNKIGLTPNVYPSEKYGILINEEGLVGMTFDSAVDIEEPIEEGYEEGTRYLKVLEDIEKKYYLNHTALHKLTIKPKSKIIDLSIYYIAKLNRANLQEYLKTEDIWKSNYEDFNVIDSKYLIEIEQSFMINEETHYRRFFISLFDSINTKYGVIVRKSNKSFCIYSQLPIDKLNIYSTNETIY